LLYFLHECARRPRRDRWNIPRSQPHRAGERFARASTAAKAGAPCSLSSGRDRDLGIDSLGRTEPVLRIERMFRIRLPVNIMDEADTVGDILIALEQTSPVARTGIAVAA
jgi:Phosphopantetheine attachment site